MPKSITPIEGCEECGFKLTSCFSNEEGVWSISGCTNPSCDVWHTAEELVRMGETIRMDGV